MSIQTDIASLRFKLNELQQLVVSTGNAALQDQINTLQDELNALTDSVNATLDIINTSVLQQINVSGSESLSGIYLNLSGANGIILTSSAASQTLIISGSGVGGLVNPVTSLTISAGPGGAVDRGILMSGSSYLNASGITYTNTFPGVSATWPQVVNKTYKSYSDGTWTPNVATAAGLAGTRDWYGGLNSGYFVRNAKHIYLEGKWIGNGYTGVAPTTQSLFLELPQIAPSGYGFMFCGYWNTITTIYAIHAKLSAGSSIAALYKVTSTGISPLIGNDVSATSSIEFAGNLIYIIP